MPLQCPVTGSAKTPSRSLRARYEWQAAQVRCVIGWGRMGWNKSLESLQAILLGDESGIPQPHRKKKLQLGRESLWLWSYFRFFQVGHWWNIFSFTQIHDEVNEIWDIGREMIGTTEIHEYISTSFNKKPALSPSGKTPPFLEKTYFHHLQAEDSVAFTEPKAQDVESEVW